MRGLRRTPPYDRRAVGRAGTVVALVVLVFVVGGANIIRSAVLPDRYHLPFNVGLAGAAIGIHWSLGLSAAVLLASLAVLYRRAARKG